jgi:hypothetical protein
MTESAAYVFLLSMAWVFAVVLCAALGYFRRDHDRGLGDKVGRDRHR